MFYIKVFKSLPGKLEDCNTWTRGGENDAGDCSLRTGDLTWTVRSASEILDQVAGGEWRMGSRLGTQSQLEAARRGDPQIRSSENGGGPGWNGGGSCRGPDTCRTCHPPPCCRGCSGRARLYRGGQRVGPGAPPPPHPGRWDPRHTCLLCCIYSRASQSWSESEFVHPCRLHRGRHRQ